MKTTDNINIFTCKKKCLLVGVAREKKALCIHPKQNKTNSKARNADTNNDDVLLVWGSLNIANNRQENSPITSKALQSFFKFSQRHFSSDPWKGKVSPLFVFMLKTLTAEKKNCLSKKLVKKQAFYCYCEQHGKTLLLFYSARSKEKHGKMKFFIMNVDVWRMIIKWGWKMS